jgi:hypothetical protein
MTGEVEKSAYDTPDSWLQELLVRRVDLGATPRDDRAGLQSSLWRYR